MKINISDNFLGKALQENTEKQITAETVSGRFCVSTETFKKNGIDLEKVNDINGCIMATATLGDEIAKTIRLGQNVTALDFNQFINEDNILGDNAVHVALIDADLYWKCWDKATKSINMNKARKIVNNREHKKIVPIYDKDDVVVVENKFKNTREAYVVNDYYIRKAEQALKSINRNTTLEELLVLRRYFGFPTRGLGESTVDVTKHIDYVFYKTMGQLVSPYINVVGGIKELTSNIKTFRKDNVKYKIKAKDDDKKRWKDFLGTLKQVSADTAEDDMNKFIEIMDKGTNLDSYAGFSKIKIGSTEYSLACAIDAVYDEMDSMSQKDLERSLVGLYYLADELGLERSSVIDVALKLAVCEVRVDGNNVIHFKSVIGTKKEYKADIWKVAKLFGDIFVAKYGTFKDANGNCPGREDGIIEVPVRYETEIDIEEGEIIDIKEGYGYGGMLHIFGVFQNGQVKVKNREVVALYDPIQTLLDKYPRAIVIPLKGYSQEKRRFSEFVASTVEQIEAKGSVGFNALVKNDNARLVRIDSAMPNHCLISVNSDGTGCPAAMAIGNFKLTHTDMYIKNIECFNGLIVADIKRIIK